MAVLNAASGLEGEIEDVAHPPSDEVRRARGRVESFLRHLQRKADREGSVQSGGRWGVLRGMMERVAAYVVRE